MSINQQRRADFMIGRMMKHSTVGIQGEVIGATLGKKCKGLWFQVTNGNTTWCQYMRCK